MNYKIVVSLVISAALLAGCDMFGGPSADLSNKELRAKWKRCKANPSPSRTAVLACENFKRECDRRKSNGEHVC